MDVEVRVPATVANLGPGFDCLGVAVGIYHSLKVSSSDKDEVTDGGTPLPRNLTFRAFGEAFDAVGEKAPPIRVEVKNSYPSARGLGASASAIIAGLVAARHLGELPLSDSEVAHLAISIEGHADNVLAALFGGLVLSSGGTWMRFQVIPEIAPIIFVASEKMKTSEARRVLPADIPRADAIANAASTAALIAVLTGQQQSEALLISTEDRLHEPYRLPLTKPTFDLHSALRSKGVATALAGAGPSLISLVEKDRVEETVAFAQDLLPERWEILTPEWDVDGAQVR